MSGYDPRLFGAKCDECYLRDRRDGYPVPPEMNGGADFVVVGEAPGSTEVEEGRPFVGKSGWELSTGLGVHGIRRHQASFTNALMCKPQGDTELDLILHKWSKENKKREREGLPILPSPMECCRGRLLNDLEGFQNIITVGKRGTEGVLGRNISIMEARGGPITLDNGQKVMPTLHPAFILRMRRWTRAFRADLGRALRWFRGESSWRQPKLVFNPRPAQLAAFLAPERPYAYDTETKSPLVERPELAKDPLLARLGLLGIATDDEVQVVSFLHVTGEAASDIYTESDFAQIKVIVRDWLTHPRKMKIDFNGYYDVPIMQRHFGVVPWPRLDNILQHRDVEPELPHGLGYVASVYAEIPYAWKIDHSGTDAETDDEWRNYNAIDCVLTYRATTPLSEGIKIRCQETPLAMHHAIQRYCIGLHRNGIWINQANRQKWDVKLREEAVGHLRAMGTALEASGLNAGYIKDFNPSSFPQLADLFFNRWGFTPQEYSKKTGEPSTGDLTLREFLRDPTLKLPERDFITKLRKFRATTKRRGLVRRLVSFREQVPKDPLSLDEDEVDDSEASRAYTESVKRKVKVTKGSKTWGLLHDDGRAHAHWNAHSVTTGWRLSSNEPNVQNWERKLREIVAPHGCPLNLMTEWTKAGHWKFQDGQPFRVFLYADQDQGEMRIIAALAGAGKLLEAFKMKKDPHAVNATDFFGSIFTNASKEPAGKSDWDRLRDFSKTAYYALAYGAAFDTAYETITSAEDAEGNLPFVNYSIRQVRSIIDRWMSLNPETVEWWEKEPALFEALGYLADPLFGYRCDFLDGEDRNKLINFRSQSLLGAIVQKAAVQLVDGPDAPLAVGKYGHGTGMILNGHDRLDFEMPVFHERRWCAKDKKGNLKLSEGWCEPGCKCPLEQSRVALTEAMRQRVPGLDVDFTGEGKVIVGTWV